MKIAYVSSSFSLHNYKFFKYLIMEGFQIHWIILVNDNEDLTSVPYHFLELDGINIYNFHDAYKQWSVGKKPAKLSYLRILREYQQILFLRKCLKGIKPDLLHGNFVQYDGFRCAISGFRPFLEMIWGDDVLVLPQKYLTSRMMLRYTLRRADAVYCDCHVVKNEIVRLTRTHPENIYVFPQLGVDMSLFNSTCQGELDERGQRWGTTKLIVMTRQMDSIYGIDVFLKAISLVIRHIDVHALIIGDGFLMPQLQKLSVDLGISNHVTFFGFVENCVLPKYLRMADLYVSSSYSDGSSISLLEAMACGKAVVVSDVFANEEWIKNGDNGLVFPRGDYEKMSHCIIDLLRNDERRNAMGGKNEKLAKDRADIDVNAKKLVELYRYLACT